MKERIRQAAEMIQEQSALRPRVGLILGSGLGILAEEIEGAVAIPYEEIPHFPVSTVEGMWAAWSSASSRVRGLWPCRGVFTCMRATPSSR